MKNKKASRFDTWCLFSIVALYKPAGYNQLFKMADRVFGGHRRKTLSGDEKGEVYQAACDSKDDGWVWRHAGNPGIYDDLWSFESDAGIKR